MKRRSTNLLKTREFIRTPLKIPHTRIYIPFVPLSQIILINAISITKFGQIKISRMFCTAKTHKSEDLSEITLENLKLRPIIDQTNSYSQNVSSFLSTYLKPLQYKEYILTDTLTFPELLRKLPPKGHDEVDVSYDVESLFTSIPISDTIDYIN